MTAATLPDSRPAPTSSGDDDPDHYYCCDPDIAMCGADLTGVDDIGDDGVVDPLCPLCAYVEDHYLPCPVPGCAGRATGPVERRIRVWLGR